MRQRSAKEKEGRESKLKELKEKREIKEDRREDTFDTPKAFTPRERSVKATTPARFTRPVFFHAPGNLKREFCAVGHFLCVRTSARMLESLVVWLLECQFGPSPLSFYKVDQTNKNRNQIFWISKEHIFVLFVRFFRQTNN